MYKFIHLTLAYLRFLFQFFSGDNDEKKKLILSKYSTVTIKSDGKLQTLN